jgi:hypothetical protein
MTPEEQEIKNEIDYQDWQAEIAYEQFLKEERANYRFRQIGLAPSMVKRIDLSIPF